MDAVQLALEQGGIGGIVATLVALLRTWTPLRGGYLALAAFVGTMAFTFLYRAAEIEAAPTQQAFLLWSTALYGVVTWIAAMVGQQAIKKAHNGGDA